MMWNTYTYTRAHSLALNFSVVCLCYAFRAIVCVCTRVFHFWRLYEEEETTPLYAIVSLRSIASIFTVCFTYSPYQAFECVRLSVRLCVEYKLSMFRMVGSHTHIHTIHSTSSSSSSSNMALYAAFVKVIHFESIEISTSNWMIFTYTHRWCHLKLD